jgi:hypothetical protein
MTIQEAMNNGIGAKILVAVLSGLLITSITAFWGLSNNVSALAAQQKATQQQITRFDDRVSDRISVFEERLSYIERRALESNNYYNGNQNKGG